MPWLPMPWSSGDVVYDAVLLAGLALVPLTLLGLAFVRAPYGRFGATGWAVGPRLGWFLMELPATVSFWATYVRGPRALETTPLVLAAIFTLHYANRGFLFPLLMRVPRGAPPTFGLPVMIAGMIVTAIHGYLHATLFTRVGAHLDPAWLADPRFAIGVLVYAAGLALNVRSDAALRALRTPEELARGERVHRIPRGGAFEWVSSPSYLGELVMWTGFAIFTWAMPAVFVLLLSAANLVPRALATHRWYRETFPDYPPARRALVPFVL